MQSATIKMSLGKKIVVLFVALGISFTAGGFLALQLGVFPAFEEFEFESSSDSVDRVMQALNADLTALGILSKEYAYWDETHRYSSGLNPEYVDANLGWPYWRDIGIHVVLIFNDHGELIYGTLGDPDTGEELTLDEQLLNQLTPDSSLVKHEESENFTQGLLRTGLGTLQVASYPILTSAEEGPIAGSFVLGRLLNDERIADLSRRATATVAITPTTEFETPSIKLTDEKIQQSLLLHDINGNPIAVVSVSVPRRITRIGMETIHTAMSFLASASAIFLLSAWLFMRRLIVLPVKKLTEQILNVRRTGDLNVQVESIRSDEVGVLALEFGELTRELGRARKELEAARDGAVALAKAKSEFLARMSHEIRTPMNGVLGMTELLQNTPLDNKQQRFTHTIHESAEALLNIINDILDFSKMEAGKFRLESIEIDLHNVLEETVDSLAHFAHDKGLELINIAPPDLNSNVHADPGRLRQVLMNLVGNAIKFTESGEVILRVNVEEMDADEVRVCFEVKDTGIGIRPEKQKDIFDSFIQEDGTTTRLYGGTGLGLAISKQLVTLMGGELAVESAPGKGSTFSFALIMKKGSDEDSRLSAQSLYVAGSKILVVDDNATNREILEQQLSGWRACIECVANASDALAALNTAADSDDPFELAILDMHMPKTDGLELARSIRESAALAELKMIILSSVATPAEDDVLQELDIAGQLTKPVRQSQLYDSLVVVLGGEAVAQTHSRLKVAKAKALTGRVLLAEDNPVNQAVAIGMMENLGVEVVVVGNGKEAVEKSSAERFDLILMDCQMPTMDGFQATHAIRGIEGESGNSLTPIVAVTANALKGDRELCLAAGMTDYLSKPFTSEQLHAVLSQYLKSWEAPLPGDTEEPIGTLSEDDSPLDRGILAGLSRLQKPGAPSIVGRVIDAYLDTSRQVTDKLRTAIDIADAALLRESAHALKSSSANVGATGLADLCKRLEVMAREEDLSNASTLREQFDAEYSRVMAALRREKEFVAA